jgi:hypothetical protein
MEKSLPAQLNVMSKEFQGMLYPGWKLDFSLLMKAKREGDDLSFNIRLERMKRRQ